MKLIVNNLVTKCGYSQNVFMKILDIQFHENRPFNVRADGRV